MQSYRSRRSPLHGLSIHKQVYAYLFPVQNAVRKEANVYRTTGARTSLSLLPTFPSSLFPSTCEELWSISFWAWRGRGQIRQVACGRSHRWQMASGRGGIWIHFSPRAEFTPFPETNFKGMSSRNRTSQEVYSRAGSANVKQTRPLPVFVNKAVSEHN